MFTWLRAKVKAAVLAGVNDAVETLEDHGANEHDDAEYKLEQRIRLLLPTPSNKLRRKDK